MPLTKDRKKKSCVAKRPAKSVDSKSHKKKPTHKKISTSQPDDSPAPGTLGYRFYSLPPELRNEIFAWLLVRPPKWDREHNASCPLRTTTPEYSSLQPYLPVEGEVVCCDAYMSSTAWRHRDEQRDPIYVDPWRSQWAPPQRNPYLCTFCYNEKHRERPYLTTVTLPCLCARRENLQILLVCRRWYEEAGQVFYTRNQFCFAQVYECSQFLKALPPRWKPFITKISLLHFDYDASQQTAEDELLDLVIPARGADGLAELWRMLSKLPALSHLELDAIFLTRLDCVKIFRGPSLKNLRLLHVRQSDPSEVTDRTRQFIWPRRALRWADGNNDFAAAIARIIKGERYGWIKGDKRDQADAMAVEQEFEMYWGRIIALQMIQSLKEKEEEDLISFSEDEEEDVISFEDDVEW
ncbi:hypothetical protein F5Y06DRAFT_295434 [Hypoxylon sp. FL0890]|nr:hypothetical protein F5Y06DRAFT_295434 [Hypoxylon sp. FL0890]